MLMIALFFYRAKRKAQKNCMEATLRQLRELSGSVKIRYSSKFNKDKIVAENHTTQSQSFISYQDIVELVLKPEIYLLVSKNKELVFVFRSQLKNEKEFLNFVFGKQTKLKPWHKMRIRMLTGLTKQKK